MGVYLSSIYLLKERKKEKKKELPPPKKKKKKEKRFAICASKYSPCPSSCAIVSDCYILSKPAKN